MYSLLSLVIKIKVVQNVNRMSETSIPVILVIPVITFEPSYQNKSCSECQQDVRIQYLCISVKLEKLSPSVSVSQES